MWVLLLLSLAGHALNLSRDREEHCLNPHLPVNYLVGSHQNDAFAVRALIAAAAGTVGLSGHRDLLLFRTRLQERSTQGSIGIRPQNPHEGFPSGIPCRS